MSVSRLLKEDEQYLYLVRYLHDDPDELPEWVFKDNTFEYAYPNFIVEADASAAYELAMYYRIDKKNGDVLILRVSND